MFSVHCSKHMIPTEPSTALRFDMFDTNDDGLLSSLEVEQLVEHALREESQMDNWGSKHWTFQTSKT